MHIKRVCVLILLLNAITSHAQQKEIIFATYTYASNNRIQNLQPLTDYLSSKTGLKIVARSYPDVRSLIQAILADSVDLAMMNTTGYLVLQKNHPGTIQTLVNLYMGNDSATNYGSCIIASRSAGIRSLTELGDPGRKMKLVLVSSSSASGNLVPRLLLNKVKIPEAEKTFQVYYAGTHKKVVDDVLNNRADIGGCGCAEIDSARKSADFNIKVAIIGSYNNTPLGPIVGRQNLKKATLYKITDLLLSLNKEDPTIFKTFCLGWTEFANAVQFKRVKDEDYDAFRKMFGNNELLWKMIE